MFVLKKPIGLIILFFMTCFAVGKNSVDSTVIKQDSIIIRADTLCQQIVMNQCDTIWQDSCQQQHRLSIVRKQQRQTRGISPNAVKIQKFDPYKKKIADMRIMETVGSHISR